MFCSVSPTYLLIRSLACLMMQRAPSALGDMLGQRGLAGAGRAVKAQAAMAARLQRLHDARQLEAALDIEHGQVVRA
jgi:hypothetical protein